MRAERAINAAAPADEKPVVAAQQPDPAAWPMPLPRASFYVCASMLIALTQGLGSGFVQANTSLLQGTVHSSSIETTWLLAAYMAPRASLTLLLMKIRTQFGLRRFAEVAVLGFVVASFAGLYMHDIKSAVVVQFFHGVAAAPMSSLAFLYMLEPFPQKLKMRVALPLALAFISLGTPLARVLTPEILSFARWQGIQMTELGFALIVVAIVFVLPVAPQPRMKVIHPMDILSWFLLALGLGSIVVCLAIGSGYWWLERPGLGMLLAFGILCFFSAVVIELHRKTPLVDMRWLMTPAMLHFTGALLIFRLVLAEQGSGAAGLFRQFEFGPEQVQLLYVWICLGTLAGGLVCALVMKPGREGPIHMVALAIIAIAAFIDAHATSQTVPSQMFATQAAVAFAGALFLPPAMMAGLGSALKKGPNYLLSFVVVFLCTQTVGGVMGSAVVSTFVKERQAFHLHRLQEQVTAAGQLTVSQISALARSFAAGNADPALQKVQAVAQIASAASTEAYVLAYNDAFLALCAVAAAALCLLILHRAAFSLRSRLCEPSPIVA